MPFKESDTWTLCCCSRSNNVWPFPSSGSFAAIDTQGDACACFRFRLTSEAGKKRHTLRISVLCLAFSILIFATVLYDIAIDAMSLTTAKVRYGSVTQYSQDIKGFLDLLKLLTLYHVISIVPEGLSWRTGYVWNLTTETFGVTALNSQLRCDLLQTTPIKDKCSMLTFPAESHNITLSDMELFVNETLTALEGFIQVHQINEFLFSYQSFYKATHFLLRELNYLMVFEFENSACNSLKDRYALIKHSAMVHSQLISPTLASLEEIGLENYRSFKQLTSLHGHYVYDTFCNRYSKDSDFVSYVTTLHNLINITANATLIHGNQLKDSIFSIRDVSATRIAVKCVMSILILLLMTTVILIVHSMSLWMFTYSRSLKEANEEFKRQKLYSDNLLCQMLPPFIANQLKQNKSVCAESFDSVTIFFSDIVGFTQISFKCTAMEVVELLNHIYSIFDTRIETYDVYKVETIGDAYMVASGVPVRNGEKHVEEIATMSIDLLAAIKQVKQPHSEDEHLEIRIGIHTGPCCAGVVGIKMPRYCLFGDTVNTASRMESTSLPLMIHISKETRDKLDVTGQYRTSLRGLTEIKGKGILETYWLHAREDMSEMNESMVCKFRPRKKRVKKMESKSSVDQLVPQSCSASLATFSSIGESEALDGYLATNHSASQRTVSIETLRSLKQRPSLIRDYPIDSAERAATSQPCYRCSPPTITVDDSSVFTEGFI